MRLILASVVLSAILFATAASVQSTDTADAHGMCRNVYGGDVIMAHGIGCRAARRVVRTWGIGYKRDGIVNRRSRGFRCRGGNDQYEGLTVRCRRGRQSIRFYANVP